MISHDRKRLDQFTVDIEFLLISVVQGVAIGALATNAADPLSQSFSQALPYVIAGFLFILNFWSQAIVHTLSFIDWPLDLSHNFLYLLVSFFEVMAFSYVDDPAKWFLFVMFFFIATAILYMFDYLLILRHKDDFQESSARKKLYKDILRQEKFEMIVFLPGGILFNIFAFFIITQNPGIFILGSWHLLFGWIQAITAGVFLINSIYSFKKRSKLITETSE